MNKQPFASEDSLAVRAQTVIMGEIEERTRFMERLRDAEALSRDLLTALHDREVQVIRLIEENHALRRRAAGYKDTSDG